MLAPPSQIKMKHIDEKFGHHVTVQFQCAWVFSLPKRLTLWGLVCVCRVQVGELLLPAQLCRCAHTGLRTHIPQEKLTRGDC